MGYLLMRAGISVTPVVLGLVLGETLEKEYRTAIILSEGHYDIFYKSPTAMAFFALALAVIGLQVWGSMRAKARSQTREREA
jgi:putative tricarboxylic transport membrane protein